MIDIAKPGSTMMSDSSVSCPDSKQLEMLLENRLPVPEQEKLWAHLDDCDSCQRQLDELTADADLLAGLADGVSVQEFSDDTALRRVIGGLQSDGRIGSKPTRTCNAPEYLTS